MKVGLKLSFVKGAVEGEYFIQLFDKCIRFSPYSFTKKHTTKEWDEKKHKKIIAKATNEETIIVDSNANDIFITTDTGTRKPHRSLVIIQERSLFMPSNEEVQSIINHQGFIVGYLYDEDYAEVQGTPFSNNYLYRNYPSHILNSVKDTPFTINQFGHKEYDTTNNPGKMDLIGHCWLMAAFKMWFASPFFDLVPKERILSFTDAYEIKELADGKIFVQLFEKIEESSSLINMEKQKKWRKWLGFEELIERYG